MMKVILFKILVGTTLSVPITVHPDLQSCYKIRNVFLQVDNDERFTYECTLYKEV
jgi:hypothetical protein